MKSFIVFALIVAAAVAAPVNPDADAQTLTEKIDSNVGDGKYRTAVQTSNGIEVQEEGQLKNVGTENEAAEVRGQFSFPGPDGVIYTVTYIANELGFQPSGAHLPQSP